MINRNFQQMLESQWSRGNFVCVGLDSEFGKIPESARKSGNECEGSIPNTIIAFNRAIVEATKDLVCAYKPNIAFYEAYGAEGITALHHTIADIHAIAPDIPVILDAKRADIGNTNNGYVVSAFSYFGADAITINPYLGAEANKPFLDCKDEGIIVLCRTSNSGAGEFQDRHVYVNWKELDDLISEDHRTTIKFCNWSVSSEGVLMPLYHYVALKVYRKWNTNGNCAIVAGATYPRELEMLRFLTHNLPFLIPGIGAQGGDVEKTVSASKDLKGAGMIINSSRNIIFASKGADFAYAARRETEKLRNLINQYR